MTNSWAERAPAKINLALHVLGRRSDGWHELDSIVAFADVADHLTFAPAQEWQLDITGPFADKLDARGNLVLDAARAFAAAFPAAKRRYRIALEKNLPIASGLGGGSADAAACLRALGRLAGGVDRERLRAIALELGADVPACLLGRACRMRGTGEKLDIIEDLAPMPAVLVNPLKPVATAEVFSRLVLKPGEKAFAGIEAGSDLASCRNDLMQPALGVAPVIGEVIEALEGAAGLRFARMSGSGASCFGVFASPETAKEAGRRIAAAHPEWWVVPTTIG